MPKVLLRHRPELVITSVGSPAPAISALHDVGCLVFADVATLRHAEKALADGADGLVLLTGGAGGNTGWLNPFAFVREVRRAFDGPIVLAGGMIDGTAVRAAEALGCDLAYVGTRCIAAREGLASDAYRQMLCAWLDDRRPAAFTPGIHGDYHLANVMFQPTSAQLGAVVDWELSTLGDPLLDLGWLLATWPDLDHDERGPLVQPRDGFPTPAELVDRYANKSARDLDAVPWFATLACLKLGVILESTYRSC